QDEDKVVVDIGTGKTPIGTPNAPSLLFSLLDEVAHQDSKVAEIQTASLVENLSLPTPTHAMDLG
ncbi:MAG: hypothetical protein V3W08_13435, partial [Candidatus Binatia bacterium]